MTTKALFGLTVVPAMMLAGIVLACLSRRIRDLFFMLLVFLAPMVEHLDVNFDSHEWYRGTQRGFEVSLLEVLSISLLASALLAPRRGESRGFWPPGLGIMLVYFVYACFNVGMADPQIFGCFGLFEMVRGCIVMLAAAFYLRSERELRIFLYTLGALVCYEGLVALKQRYVDGYHRVPGTIDDSNSLSVFFCMTAPLFVAALNSRLPIRMKFLSAAAIALAVVGEVLTISRMGLINIALVLFVATLCTIPIAITPKKIVFTLLVALAVTGVTMKSWKTLESRFKETNLHEEYGNKRSLGRGYYIRIAKAIIGERVFGVGVNNWSYWASNRYGPRLGYHFVPYRGTEREPSQYIPPGSNVDEAQAAPAHNLGALTLGELGIPGLVIFALVWLRWLQMGASFLWPRRPDPVLRIGVGLLFGLCGLFLQSITEWVFWQSPIFYTFNILLGTLVSLYYIKRRAKKHHDAPITVEETSDYEPEPSPVGYENAPSPA